MNVVFMTRKGVIPPCIEAEIDEVFECNVCEMCNNHLRVSKVFKDDHLVNSQ